MPCPSLRGDRHDIPGPPHGWSRMGALPRKLFAVLYAGPASLGAGHGIPGPASRWALWAPCPRLGHVTQPEPSSSSRGLFIALEGGDGAGKSTQGRLLRAWLEDLGRTVVMTCEPGGTEFGRTVRELVLHGDHVAPRAEALLFAADRAHHVETLIRPALGRGEVVITDRYMDSSIAYQGAGRDLGVNEVRDLNVWATAGLVPALTVLVDLPPAVGRARRGGVDDRLEAEADEFHVAVREHFLALAGAEPDRYLVVDGQLPPERVQELVRARVAAMPDVAPR
jgi:dTMP kinase